MVERQAERAELLLVPAGAERGDEAAAAQLVDGRSLSREDSRRVERRARDERPELDALGDPGEPGERRPAVPRPALAAPVAAVEQVVADPERVEAALFRRARHRRELVATHDALDLRQLNADLHAQNASNAGKSSGTAVTSAIWPSRISQKSAWSMSSVRPSRSPCAR